MRTPSSSEARGTDAPSGRSEGAKHMLTSREQVRILGHTPEERPVSEKSLKAGKHNSD